MLFVFNWIREHHGDWASSPFSYPEVLAYLLFVYHIMLCTFITVISLYLL